jgi:hypothetical protein
VKGGGLNPWIRVRFCLIMSTFFILTDGFRFVPFGGSSMSRGTPRQAEI